MTRLAYPSMSHFPVGLREIALKLSHAYIMQELLRVRHNEEGFRYRSGEIDEQAWQRFLIEWFEPRMRSITADLLELKEAIKNSANQYAATIDLEKVPRWQTRTSPLIPK